MSDKNDYGFWCKFYDVQQVVSHFLVILGLTKCQDTICIPLFQLSQQCIQAYAS